MNIDKQNGDLGFDESKHAYFSMRDPSRRYISVTTLIHKFELPFDRDFWSAYKAVEKIIEPDLWRLARKQLLDTKKWDPGILKLYSIPENDFNSAQQDILDDWQRENKASTDRGTEIHANLENSFYSQRSDISLQKFGIGGKFECIKGKTELDLDNGVYPEYMIHYDAPDGKLGLAGQIDLLVKEGNSFSIIDWKGLALDTKILTLHGWKTMETIAVGDKVFDSDGRPCAVIHKSEVHHNQCYEITFCTGETITADADHKWLVETVADPGKKTVFTTKELAYRFGEFEHVVYSIPYAKALDYPYKPGLEDLACPSTAREAKAYVQQFLDACIEQREEALRVICTKFMKTKYSLGYYVFPRNACTKVAKELMVSLGMHITTTDTGTLLFSTGPLNILQAFRPWTRHSRIITSVVPVMMVPTQCIEVDSPLHTYLCTESLITTHNTNKQIKTSSYYDNVTKKSEKMLYPLNGLDNCNYSTYNMQLSTYAWMVQQMHPEWKCNSLVLVHFDKNNNMTTYNMDYLKENVEKMLAFWKKQGVLDAHRQARKRISY